MCVAKVGARNSSVARNLRFNRTKHKRRTEYSVLFVFDV